MLKLETKTRDEIVSFLQAQVVSARVGAGLMECARILANLKEVETPKEDLAVVSDALNGEVKTDDDNKEPEVSN